MKPAAFANAFARHARLFWVVAAAHAPRAQAEDIVQDAAMIALGKLRDVRDDAGFRPWMARIVRNVAHNAARRSVRDAHVLPLDDSVGHQADVRRGQGRAGDAGAIPRIAAMDADSLGLDDALASALDVLPGDARACLLLSVVGGLSYEEIAAIMELPAGTVGSHVSRARAALRAELSPTEASP